MTGSETSVLETSDRTAYAAESAEEGERVLIIEDDRALRDLLEDEVRDIGLAAEAVSSVEAAAPLLSGEGVDLVVSDLRLPGASGLDLIHRSRALHLPPAFIIITGFGTIPQAVECLKAGADDFLTKPLDLDHLSLSITRALERRRLLREVQRYRAAAGPDDFHGMIGRCPAMRRLYDQILRIARADGPVLIQGESGVGKELVARALHEESDRRDAPFLAVNCAGIPQDLLESEFFGHAAGAFTGATRSRNGLFAEADGGTLLLDEIGEMPAPLQAKLLRVLQDGKIRPVGSDRERHVDVRILSATHQEIEASARAGDFREDLFYRLSTFTLHVPPLRDRGDDLELLAGHFLNHFAARLERDIRGFTAEALELIRSYEFPGNVRELHNAIERAVTFCERRLVAVEHLPARMHRSAPVADSASGHAAVPSNTLIGTGPLPTLAEIEQRYIRYVLEEVGGNKRRAAALLGIGRRTLYRRIESSEEREP